MDTGILLITAVQHIPSSIQIVFLRKIMSIPLTANTLLNFAKRYAGH
jgi:hypothetical protein